MNSKRELLRRGRDCSFLSVLLGAVTVLTGCGSEPAPSTQVLAAAPVPAVESACADGLDNDRDGTVDCADVDCQSPGGECKPAPPLDRTVATTVAESAAYLYTGTDPLQKGVAANALDPKRLAMLRGRTIDASGKPLAGVKVTVKGHPEYGSTYSRGDGAFDMAVNGGGQLTLSYELAAHLPVERSIRPGWQRYALVPDAGLIAESTKVTTVSSGAGVAQLILGDAVTAAASTGTTASAAAGSAVPSNATASAAAGGTGSSNATASIAAGITAVSTVAHQPLVIVEPNTTVNAMLPNGTAQPLATLTVTATEYPITEEKAFAPGSAVAADGLSYGLEFTVSEASALGAEHVTFSKPVSLYVEDLASLAPGKLLTVQHYDRATSQWEPGAAGSVIQLLGAADGDARIDGNGDGIADEPTTLDKLGITASDRAELAKRYLPGQLLWHAELNHFSGSELTAQGTPPAGAVPPVLRGIVTKPLDNPTYLNGMAVERQASVHSEPITGTPYSLRYQSDRTLSYGAGRQLDVPLVGDSIPTGLKKIKSRVAIANRVYEKTFSVSQGEVVPNLRHTVIWDGTNSAGVLMQAQQSAEVSIGYVYADAKNSKLEAILPVKFSAPLGNWDARAFGLGGFSIDVHHSYDPAQQILYYGHGAQRSAANVALAAKPASTVSTFDLGTPDSLAVAADGSLIVTDDQTGTLNFGRILQLAADGTPKVMYGAGALGLAAATQFTQPAGIVVKGDGSLVLADIYDNKLYELSPTGVLKVLVSGNPGDSPLVLQALNHPDGLALGPREALYFVDSDKVYRLEANQLTVVAGGGTETTDGGLATNALLVVPSGLAVDKSGNVYVSERGKPAQPGGHRVRQIAPNGTITSVSGTGTPGYSGDGDVASAAALNGPHGLAIDDQDQLYIVDQGNLRIRRISADGLIQTVIGGGTEPLKDGSLAVNVQLESADGIAMGPDGSLYIAMKHQVLRAFVGLANLNKTDNLVPSLDGRKLYHFDQRGKHLETIDTVTGVTEYVFGYGKDSGLLESITDKDGHQTLIQRDASNLPIAIKAPYGQLTKLVAMANPNAIGDLASITDPLGRTTMITWDHLALLGSVSDPKARGYVFGYDPVGRLTSVTDPTGYSETLARSESANGWSVAVTNTANQTTNYSVQHQNEAWKRSVTRADKSKSTLTDTGAKLTRVTPDGTQEETRFMADMAFGPQTIVPTESTMTLPSGKTLVTEYALGSRHVADISNPLSLIDWTDSVAQNDQWSISVYDRASKTLTRTSPTGRKTQITFDSKGNPLQMTAAGMPSRNWAYDDHSRVKTVTTTAPSGKTRVQSYDYDADGWVKHFADPLSEVTEYRRDEVGRVTRMTASDGTSTEWVMDYADNVTRLTPASTVDFLFDYDVPSKLLTGTRAPSVASTSINAPAADATGKRPTIGGVAFDYNLLANQLKAIRRSDGRSIGFNYDALGRLSEQKLGSATIQYAYTNGHLTRINRSDSVTLDQTFDGPLWTSSAWTGAVKGNVKATYDKNLALSSLTVNDQSSVSFTYDADGLLTAATATVGAVTFARDAQSGNLTGVSVGNTTGTVTYGEFGEVSSIATSVAGAGSTAGAALFQQNIVERDALGRIKHLTETVQGVSHDVMYEYDQSGRLAQQTRDGIVTTFTFDTNGNRRSVQEGTAAPIVATYDAQDRILTRGTSVFNHSDHGDIELRTGGATSLALSYDELGNLLRAVSSDGALQTTIEYKVDGLGRRVARMVGGKFDKAWLYRDSLRPIAEVTADGTFTHFVYASNSPLSGAPVALIRGGTLYRVVKDHIGSVRLVVNAQTGAVAQSIDYDANGRVLNEMGAGFQPFGFAGGLYDATTGLVRFGARDYDPELGRWTNRDPIGFAGQQGNQHAYVGNDPVNRSDPDGQLDPLSASMGFGALVGAVGGAISYAITTDKVEWRSLVAAAAGGGVAGALAPYLAAELIASGLVTSIAGAGIWANAATGVVGSVTTSVLDPKQKVLSSSTALNAVSSGAFGAAGYAGAGRLGRLFAGSQFFAESNLGGVVGVAVGLAPTCGLDALVDYWETGKVGCSMSLLK